MRQKYERYETEIKREYDWNNTKMRMKYDRYETEIKRKYDWNMAENDWYETEMRQMKLI